MNTQALPVSLVAGGAQSVERPHDSAMPVVGVLEGDRRRDRLVRVVARSHRDRDLLRGHHPRLGRNRADLNAAYGSGSGSLIEKRM